MTTTTRPVQLKALTFQELLLRLQSFWAERGCVLAQPYDVEVGAGTMSPDTFLRVLGPDPIAIAYTQPSRRPADGRYGENPNRLYKHTQLQVILKPPPADIQEIYLESLEAIGIRLREHDIKFEEDNWEWPVGGAWGVGWQVMLDGLEITQFTYFQQCGGMDLDPISGEITYGLERIAAFLQDVDSIYDVVWARGSEDGARGDLRRDSPAGGAAAFGLQLRGGGRWKAVGASAPVRGGVPGAAGRVSKTFRAEKTAERHEKIHDRLVHDGAATPADEDVRVALRRFPVLAAYELCLKCSHLFNLLDARGAISVTERVAVMARIRNMVVGVAKAYATQRQNAGGR